MALTKVTGQVIKNTTDVTVGVLTVTNTLAVGGTVSIGGTLTYEDVTNIDSVGLITARNGIIVGSGITLSKDGDGFFTGVVTATSYAGDGSGLTGVAGTENIRTNTNATFLQNVNVSGTTTVAGNINANGNIVGDNSTDITGINDVTLSTLSISDTIVHTGDTDTKIRFPSSNTFTVETAGDERLRIASDGKVGIGDASPDDALLSIKGDSNEASNPSIRLKDGTDTREAWITNTAGDLMLVNGGDDNTPHCKITLMDANIIHFSTANTERARIDSSGHLLPSANNTYDLGSSSTRWRDIYTNDLNLSNKGGVNDVDGTWGDYTIQEGENDLFLINNRSGKKYKFNLTEVS